MTGSMISFTAASSWQGWLDVHDVAAQQLAGFTRWTAAEGEVQVPRPQASRGIVVVWQYPRRDRRESVTMVGEDE